MSTTETERELLRDTVGQLLAEQCTPERVAAAAGSEAGWDAAAWRALQETGLTLVGSAEESGGSGGDLSQAADIAVAAGAAAAPVPLAETLAAGMVLARAGLAIPDGPLTLAVAGPAGGAEAVGSRSAGPGGPGGGRPVLLRRVPYGRVASTVVAGTGKGRDWLCVVPPPEQVTAGYNLAGEPRDDIELGPEAPVRVVAPGTADHAGRLRQLFRSLLIAGAAQRALELTITYVTEREQFGRPLGKMPVVQSELARMAGEVALIGAATQAAVAAGARSGGEPGATAGGGPEPAGGPGRGTMPAVLAAKAQASAGAGVIAAIAHQLHGAIGTTQEHRLRLTTTRLWAWRDEDGPAAECFAELGRAAVAASAPGSGGLWPWLSGT